MLIQFKFIRKAGRIIPIPANAYSKEALETMKSLKKMSCSISHSKTTQEMAKKRLQEMVSQARSVKYVKESNAFY